MSQTLPAERLSTGTIVALSLVGTLAWLTMTLLPYEVLTLAMNYGSDTAGAGWIVAAELLAVAISAAWFGRTIDARDKRNLSLLGVAIAVLASVGSILVGDLNTLICLRLLFGIGCGMLAAATGALPTLDADPQRVFAWMQFAVGVVFGVATFATGYAGNYLGREYVFIIELGFVAVLGGCAFLLPRGVGSGESSTGEKQALSGPVIACIAAAGLTWVALSAVWAFAAQAATAAGITDEMLAVWFAISGFMTPLGAVAAAALGERRGYVFPLVVGFLTLVVACLGMYLIKSPEVYIAGVLILNFPMTFVMCYVMAVLAGLDHTGRGPSVGGAAINLGGAAGPALGALALGSKGLAVVGVIGAAILLTGLALASMAALRLRPAEG